MPLEIMIVRDPPPTLDEWKAAVCAVGGAKLAREDALHTNPVTGEQIHIPGQDGDAVVGRIPLRFAGFGILVAVPPGWPDDPNAPGRAEIFALADRLGASVMTEHDEPVPRVPGG